MGGYTNAYERTYHLLPSELGFNGVIVANGAPVTSEIFSIDGFNQLSIAFALTRVAATSVTAYLEVSFDQSVWFRQQRSSFAGGTESLVDHTMSKAVTGSTNWWHNFGGIMSPNARLVVTGVAGTTDTIVIHIVRGCV